MRNLTCVLKVGFSVVLAVAFAASAWAGEPTDQLRTHVDEVLKVLENPALRTPDKADERRDVIRKVANQIFDFEETAKRALGPHWQARTPAERKEFVALFTDLLERSYVSRIEQYGGEKVTYLSDQVTGDQALVKTRIVSKTGTDIPVDYRMLKMTDGWRVYDVNIEGVSLVSNYRTQFNKIVQTESYQALVDRLKARGGPADAAASPKTPRREPR
jgi:phospholipid transport system substrate-binding protein